MAAYDWIIYTAGSLLGLAGITILAIALFKDRSRARRRCPKCWYDMTGVPGLQCPECGKKAAAENKLFKTRRRWRWAIMACLLMVAGGGTAGTPKLKRDGSFALVPVPVLNWIASHFDEQANELYEREATMFGWPVSSTRLSAWERVLIGRAAGNRLYQVILADPASADPLMLIAWMRAASRAEDEVRLIAPPFKLWVADPDHPLSAESVIFSGWLAQLTRPIPGLAPLLLRRAEQALERGDEWPEGILGSLAANDSNGRRTIPIALGVLHDGLSARWRSDAIGALSVFVGRDERALEAVIGAVNDQEETFPYAARELDGASHVWRVCDEALNGLTMAGSDAAPAIPRLEQIANEHPDLRDQIEQTISAIRADMETGN